MPLAATFNLQWYGEGSAAAITSGAGLAAAAIKGFSRAEAETGGAGAVVLARPTRLRGQPATLFGAGQVLTALPKGRARPSAQIRVNALSQDDVTGAVLDTVIEGGLSLRQVLRLLLAQAAGNATGLDGGTITFKSLDGSKTRVSGTISGGTRTVTTRDAS